MAKHLEITITAPLPDGKTETTGAAVGASQPAVEKVIAALHSLGIKAEAHRKLYFSRGKRSTRRNSIPSEE